MRLQWILDSAVCGLWAAGATGASCGPAQFTALELKPFFNNKAFGQAPDEAAFDGQGQSFPDPKLGSKTYTSSDTGIEYAFPGYTGRGSSDNVITSGQSIPAPNGTNGTFFSASFLVATDVDLATISRNVTFGYTDGSKSLYELRSLPWYATLTINRGEIVLPFRYDDKGRVNHNTTHIFERTAALSPGKQLASITLPTTTNATEGRLHVFAITLVPGGAGSGAAGLSVQGVRPTQKWMSDNGTQVVEVTVNNAGSECVTGSGMSVSLEGEGLRTVMPGRVKRLCPGDQKIVVVGVEGKTSPRGSSSCSTAAALTVVMEDGKKKLSTAFPGMEIGLREWKPDASSLRQHESPAWFDAAKYGIFIHWGPYAVTGWGNTTPHESYAEWFWWYSTNHPQGDRSNFYEYRRATFGEQWAYDDTFPQFKGEKWDPKAWVDLFDDAGAKYFVITSKHHDGFALFDTGATSNRSSLHYGPKRDVLRELFDASAKYHPDMKRGTYYSLPEWFNPSYEKYGFDQFNKTLVPSTVGWPGGLAKNPYTGVTEPYTGHVPLRDYVTDLQVPQMEILARDYGTDIMWCDCGTANGTSGFAAKWWNDSRRQNRQVVINSRCGDPSASDFDTPEYQTFSSTQRHKWESSRGLDPFSYGYNRATPDAEYMNASVIVRSLVDIVSKNGNFLLDVGPRADGTIVEQEAANLREAGKWIKTHGEAIFNTTYWFVQSQIVADGAPDVRFTQNEGAFFVLFLDEPRPVDGMVRIPAPVPVLDGDVVSLLGVEGGDKLGFEIKGQGSDKVLNVKVGSDVLAKEKFCWVFKVQYA